MKNDIYWSSSDYNTAEEKESAMELFRKQLKECFEEETCSYEEYKKERTDLINLLDNTFLKQAKEKGFYMVKNCFSDDIYAEEKLLFKHPFNKSSDVFKYIKNVQTEHLDTMSKEQKELMWWDISWYEIVDGEYEGIYAFSVDFNLEIISFRINYYKFNGRTTNQRDILNWLETMHQGRSSSRKRVELPYSVGDIVKINQKPFKANYKYVVYTGYNNEGITNGMYNELARTYYFSFLGSIEMVDGVFRKPTDFETVETCENVLIMRLSNFLKKNPKYYCDLVQNCVGEYWKRSAKINDFARMVLSDLEKILLNGIDKNLTLQEYINNVNIIRGMFVDKFSESLQDDEVYSLQAQHCNGEMYSKAVLFKSYDQLQEYMNCESNEISGEWSETQWFWKIERQKRIHNKYETIMRCKADNRGNVVDFNLGDSYEDVDDNRVLNQAMKLVNLKSDNFAENSPYDLFSDDTVEDDGANIQLPFETGDILCIDKTPVKKMFYVVYLGKRKVHGTTIHYCLKKVEGDDCKLSLEHLSHPFSFEKEGNSYYPFVEKACSCDDRVLNKVSVVLKQHPELEEQIKKTGVSFCDNDKVDKLLNQYI